MPWLDDTPDPDSVDSQLGPCTLWVDPTDLVCLDDTLDATLVAAAASQLLYEWSARLYPGVCDRVARPCGSTDCWGFSAAATRWNLSAWVPRYPDMAPALCGCTPYRRIPLSGYPVRAVSDVSISGDLVDASAYRVEDERYLVRTDGGFWPACQDMRRPLGEDGTFGVTYTAGTEPPASGIPAASQLACWLGTQMLAGACDLPPQTTNVSRQGITYNLNADMAGQARALPLVIAFLDSVNPARLRRRPAFWSPDTESFAR